MNNKFYRGYTFKNIIGNPLLFFKKQFGSVINFFRFGWIHMKMLDRVKSVGRFFNTTAENLASKVYENKALQNPIDDLTSLYNHRHFHQIMREKKNSSIDSLSIIFLDIDKFKIVNDTHGHVVGDRILKTIGEIIKKSLPDNLHGFKYGGEEFVILAENFTLDATYSLAEDLRSKIVTSNLLQNHCGGSAITVSTGIAAHPEHTKTPENLLSKAERAMYFAKQNGGNQTYIYNKNIENFLRENNDNFRKKGVQLDSAMAFAAAIDAKDNYTGKHSEMVAKYSLLLAEEIDLSKENKCLLRIGALLHDCGKIGVPDSLLGKEDKLSTEEYRVIKDHTLLGNNILKHVIDDESVMSCIRNHHEKWDGSGYPDALSGEEIPLYARIVTLADAFHAMTSDRPYRKAFSLDTAIMELRANSGTQFDPSLVEKFIKVIHGYHETNTCF